MAADLRELGSTGLDRMGGVVQEEFLPELRGDKWTKVIRRMSEQDAIVGAILFAIEMQIRNVDYDVTPASDDPRAVEIAEFVESCLDDMSMTWCDTMSEILTMLPYGWDWMEQVYKVRQGPSKDPKRNSKHSDGKIGWRKWSVRGQDTLSEWQFDEDGGVQGMWQAAPPRYQRVFIPIDKSLLFRTTARKGNPEGRSVLRTAYEAWYYKVNIQRVEAIGIERDLNGLPVIYAPANIMSTDASAAQVAQYEALKDIVTNIRNDEMAGVVMPQVFDENSNRLYELTLLASAGARQFDTDAVIARYDQRIAMSVLADFILLGHESTGTYSLGSSKSSMFTYAITSWLKSIADVINRHAIPRLLRYNGWPEDLAPMIEFGEVGEVSLAEIADYVEKLTGANIITPDEELEDHMRTRANLPQADESTRREKAQPVAIQPTPDGQTPDNQQPNDQPQDDQADDQPPQDDGDVNAAMIAAYIRMTTRGE